MSYQKPIWRDVNFAWVSIIEWRKFPESPGTEVRSRDVRCGMQNIISVKVWLGSEAGTKVALV